MPRSHPKYHVPQRPNIAVNEYACLFHYERVNLKGGLTLYEIRSKTVQNESFISFRLTNLGTVYNKKDSFSCYIKP